MYRYRIAGLNILCSFQGPIIIHRESEEFLDEAEENEEAPDADFKIDFLAEEKLPEMKNGFHQEGNRRYGETEKERYVYYLTQPDGEPYACMEWKKEETGKGKCRYLPEKQSYIRYSRNLFELIGLEWLLLLGDGVLLHASFIRWKGQGILFSAPSGTGKSTQAKLWESYEKAEILNGDRAALRKTDGKWMAYGLPYAGSSGIYRNESAPVSAIVALRQAKKNEIRPLRPSEAVRYLFPEVTVHRWDRDFAEKIINLLTELFLACPVYLLECRPDRGAVYAVKNMMEKQEEKRGKLLWQEYR